MRRYLQHRKTWIEWCYVALFILFGYTDILESQAVALWLILAKGLILTNILITRLYLVRVHYVGSKL